MKQITIKEIKKDSIAEALQIVAGDILLKINDEEITDYLDYKFQISDETITIDILKQNGEAAYFEIEKELEEDLGLLFEHELIDEPKKCLNNCIFCFMDQLPQNVRETLLFKDDDYRLSFFTGNYVTLTNAKDEDIERIIKYRLSPINISVHATDETVRCQMLNNKNAGKILGYIEKLTNAALDVNIQIVLCKGINDKEILDKTIRDLEKFMLHILSISIVPVGLTKYREGLFSLEKFTKQDLKDVIEQVKPDQEQFKKKYSSRIVFLSDEFYLESEAALPTYHHYENFPQIENGVGLTAEFLHEFHKEHEKLVGTTIGRPHEITICCGTLIYPTINELAKKMKNFNITVYPIKNYFFGENITVTGLITGSDLITNLKGKTPKEIYISEVMLKEGEDVFLDNMTIAEVEQALSMKLIKVPNNGRDFARSIYGAKD